MSSRMNWVRGVAVALVATVMLAAAAAVFAPGVTRAAAAVQQIEQRGFGGQDGGSTLLAEALGISVEELEAAQAQATNAAIDQALAEGLITEEQAAQLRERSDRFGPLRNFARLDNDVINYDALLADALGISVDALDAAKQSAQEAALVQAVENGRLSQEEADLIQARQAIRETLRERVQGVYEEVVNESVADGAITQAQADALLSSERGFGFERGFGGGRGHHGRSFRGDGDFDSQPNEVMPESTDETVVPGSSI